VEGFLKAFRHEPLPEHLCWLSGLISLVR
jgi:hypothetical protein